MKFKMKQIKKLKIVVVLAASLLLLFALFAVVNAQGHTADQLENAGWVCENVGPRNWKHCNKAREGAKTIIVKVFNDPGHPFLGTEILVHESIYNGQPCSTDDGEPYHDLGNGYLACHLFDTAAAEAQFP